MTSADPRLLDTLTRIADALERLAPSAAAPTDPTSADAFVWSAEGGALKPVPTVAGVELDLLRGIDRARDTLVENTRRFALGLPANNALLWGARGMGKSSLVKAAHGHVLQEMPGSLALVEIHREDIPSLPALLSLLRGAKRRFVLFCDDLTFDGEDDGYKSLKAVLEGGLEGRPANVVFYATSNRRHMLSREMIENEQNGALIPGEAVEEKVSLSDRFGLWLGFHPCSQDDFFAMIDGYVARHGLKIDPAVLRAEARAWQVTRGSRSGRVAWQFVVDLAGRLGQPL